MTLSDQSVDPALANGAPDTRNGHAVTRFLKTHWAILLILCLGFALRWKDAFLHGIDWDESNVLAISKLPLKDMVWFTFTHDFHPPGVHMTLAAWTFLWGDSDLSLRSFGVLWGMLAIVGAYWLAQMLSKRRFISSLTALFVALMPVGIRYSLFATSAPVHFAMVFFSWIFFLKLLETPTEKPLLKSGWFWLYVLTTFWNTQQYASGPYFMLFQGLYFLTRWKDLPSQKQKILLGAGVFILALSIPHALVVMQPWHLSHVPSIKALHPIPTFSFFFFSPLGLLFYNYDLRTDGNDLTLMPPLQTLFTLASIVYPLLIYAFWRMSRTVKSSLTTLAFIGVLPFLVAYLLGFAGFSLFNHRSLLYTVFPFCFALAFLIDDFKTKHKPLLAGMIACAVVSMQLVLPPPLSKFSSTDWRVLGHILKTGVRPGDGIVAYPGFMALPLMRYYKPADFGYGASVLKADPTQGNNYFNQIDRIDDQYFMVSGMEAGSRPWVQQAFKAFQARHKRLIWFLAAPPFPLMPLIDCHHEALMLTPQGLRPLTCGPAAEMPSGIAH
jgi:4-amino-4-deoxy-L-arabinose transferase-like glycosyltransferase